MPTKVLPSAEQFALFSRDMVKLGFRPLHYTEFRRDSERLGLLAPPRVARQETGREAGFRYDVHDLTVKVWTTFLAEEGHAREEDAGWVVIAKGDRAQYFSHPIHRTEHFLNRLFEWARIAKERVDNRPLCPLCQGYMSIARGAALKSRYWECRRYTKHPAAQEVMTMEWDTGLSAKSREFVRKERDKRARYRQRATALGGKPGTAMLERRTSVPVRPHNLEPAQ